MLLATVGLVVGLAVLTIGADQFVIGAARLSYALRISPVVIGAVVIGFGTSAPELLVSGLASAQGEVDIAAGNIIGSNAANLTLVLGTAALVTPVAVRSSTLKREAPLSLASVLMFAWLLQGGMTVVEGVLLTVALAGFLGVLLRSSRSADTDLATEVDELLPGDPIARGKETMRALLGLVLTVGGAQTLVVAATSIARSLGLDEGFVGLTVVAIGTSLPELATSVQAARRRETDLIVGNLLGSNVLNSTAVAATMAFAGPDGPAHATLTGPATLLMIFVATVATAFMLTGKRVTRWEGVTLLAIYAVIVPWLAG